MEAKDDIAGDIISEHRIYLMRSYENNDVTIHTSEPVHEIYGDGVKTENLNLRGYDTVVMALGSRSYQPFDDNLVPLQYVIGDANKARRAIDATREAREVILKI